MVPTESEEREDVLSTEPGRFFEPPTSATGHCRAGWEWSSTAPTRRRWTGGKLRNRRRRLPGGDTEVLHVHTRRPLLHVRRRVPAQNATVTVASAQAGTAFHCACNNQHASTARHDVIRRSVELDERRRDVGTEDPPTPGAAMSAEQRQFTRAAARSGYPSNAGVLLGRDAT